MIGTLANFLFELAARAAGKEPRGQTLRLRVRREDLPRRLDLTPAALEREFERLVARRAISLSAEDTVTVLDREALQGPRQPSRPAPFTPEDALRAILADERFRAAPRGAGADAGAGERTDGGPAPLGTGDEADAEEDGCAG